MNFARFFDFVVSVASLAFEQVGNSHAKAHHSGGEANGVGAASEEIIILEDGGRFDPDQCR